MDSRQALTKNEIETQKMKKMAVEVVKKSMSQFELKLLNAASEPSEMTPLIK